MRTLVLGTMFLALASLACNNSVGPLKSNVQVSFATRGPAAAPAPAPAPSVWRAPSNDTLSDSTHTIVITKAQVVLRQIELSQVQGTGCATAGECEVQLGPVLVDLPLVPGAQQAFAVEIPPGSYDEVDFEVHKVTTQDPADLQAALLDRSIHVGGTFDGQAFTFESALDVEQELRMQPPVVATDTTAINITIHVALDGWFRNLVSGTLLDPRDAQNRSAIEQNIQISLHAFEDDNHDGVRDP
jgi:hypothetical protein